MQTPIPGREDWVKITQTLADEESLGSLQCVKISDRNFWKCRRKNFAGGHIHFGYQDLYFYRFLVPVGTTIANMKVRKLSSFFDQGAHQSGLPFEISDFILGSEVLVSEKAYCSYV